MCFPVILPEIPALGDIKQSPSFISNFLTQLSGSWCKIIFFSSLRIWYIQFIHHAQHSRSVFCYRSDRACECQWATEFHQYRRHFAQEILLRQAFANRNRRNPSKSEIPYRCQAALCKVPTGQPSIGMYMNAQGMSQNDMCIVCTCDKILEMRWYHDDIIHISFPQFIQLIQCPRSIKKQRENPSCHYAGFQVA